MPLHVSAPSVEAPRTIAAGVVALQPRPISSAEISAAEASPISTTTVVECGASDAEHRLVGRRRVTRDDDERGGAAAMGDRNAGESRRGERRA